MAHILPKTKQKVLQFLKDYIAEHGYAPTLTEIAKHLDVSALSTVHEHLQFLQERGFIDRLEGEERGISLSERVRTFAATVARSISLPVVGVIAAGSPIEAIEQRDVSLAVPEEIVRGKNAYVLKVRGDSMIESFIADGDYVVIEKTDFAKDGDTVVALLDDGNATLKKFFKKRNFIRLQPANRTYSPIDVKSVVIQGKVLGVIRQY
ncbi:MAG: transcriptional repressor LexA [Candidatus Kerfeldbacteria bacterium]|nr:transcriptional repressor LexA [Candidatus Kerfeldbacteria bacterium]